MSRIAIILVCLSLTACASFQPQKHEVDETIYVESAETADEITFSDSSRPCKFIERNLTVRWADRSYWCVP